MARLAGGRGYGQRRDRCGEGSGGAAVEPGPVRAARVGTGWRGRRQGAPLLRAGSRVGSGAPVGGGADADVAVAEELELVGQLGVRLRHVGRNV